MNNLDPQKEHLDTIQKDLTSVCFEHCFSTKTLDLEASCLDGCYDDYIKALKITTKKLKSEGYRRASMYAFKVFPINYPLFEMMYGTELGRDYYDSFDGIKFERNYMNKADGF